MDKLVNEIRNSTSNFVATKQERIVIGVRNCIKDQVLNFGDVLPSVNELSGNLGYSRETVVKAYNQLKQRGILQSKQGVGFFVSNNNPDLVQSIALVLYGFQTFQQDFYNRFRSSLGVQYKIDIFFHHNNIDVFDSILDVIYGKYGMYVVAPIQDKQSLLKLEKINSDRLLLIDRYQYIDENVSTVTQEFEHSMLRVLDELMESIQKYDSILLYYRDDMDYPSGIYSAVKNFTANQGIKLEVKNTFEEKDLRKGVLYFTIGDSDLWSLLKATKENDYQLGVDIGVLSHNDTPVKEIILGGITTFSTDFNMMAEHAATFVKKRDFVSMITPSILIKRNSL